MAPIPLSEFPAHVAHMHQDRDKGFEREYGAVPNTEAAHEVATLNKLKNRFANIYPCKYHPLTVQSVSAII